MARLVAVFHDEETRLEERQIPLLVDDALAMVLQFDNPCSLCEGNALSTSGNASSTSSGSCGGGGAFKGLQRFVQRFEKLSSGEKESALTVEGKEVFQNLAQMFPCVGCRRSVERMFNDIKDYEHNALHPLFVNAGYKLTLANDYKLDPKLIYSLFYVHGSKCNSILDAIPKSKKNKRCLIHSLETQKPRTMAGNWMDVWEALSQECREELVRVEQDGLVDTVETYLRKHRFCSECKSKVMKAYHLLIGEENCNKEKGYCPSLYEGLRSCSGDSAADRHVHVLCDTHYIATLISRAEPELAGGNRRERHAKTIDIAQEEILTCIGVYLYERLVRVWQRLRAEEQTWQILFFLSVETLKKSLEIALENSEGISQFELVCEEFEEEERVKQQKKIQKRQKKKQRQATKAKSEENSTPPPTSAQENDGEKDESGSSLGVTPALSPDDELQSGCSECRHLLTDENAQPFDSCPNCKRLLNSKVNNNSKNCRSLNANPECWSPKPVLVTSSSVSSSSLSSSSSASPGLHAFLSPCLTSPSCRDNGYFSGHESASGTPCSSSEGSRSEDHCGDSVLGSCARCFEGGIRHGENGTLIQLSPKTPLKVKNANNSESCGQRTCKMFPASPNFAVNKPSALTEEGFAVSDRASMGLSLEEMLDHGNGGLDDDFDHSCDDISAEDIDFFRSNKHRLQQQRQELRSKLKSQFLDMQRRLGCASPSCTSCTDGSGDRCGGGGGGVERRNHVDNYETNSSEIEKTKIHGMRA